MKIEADAVTTIDAESQVEVPPPLPLSAPGLGPLVKTDKVLIIKKNTRIPFKTVLPMASHYHVLNQRGVHIYTICQADPGENEKFFLMEMFTVQGHLILRIVQRWKEPMSPTDEDFIEILPFYKKDQELPSLVLRREGAILQRTVKTYELKHDDPDTHIHVRHVDGDFLGHVWKGTNCWIIHDANLIPKFTFPKISTSKRTARYAENARPKRDCFARKYSYYEYYNSRGYESSFTSEPVGFIETGMNPGRYEIRTTSEYCSCAHFPTNMAPVEKVLILAMTLTQYCKASTSVERTGCTCFWLCVFLSVIVCTIVVVSIVLGICVGMLDNDCRNFVPF